MTTEKTDTKELARQARLLLATAKAVKQALEECTAPELSGYRYTTDHAVDEMIKAAVTCHGIKIAVFEEKDGAQ